MSKVELMKREIKMELIRAHQEFEAIEPPPEGITFNSDDEVYVTKDPELQEQCDMIMNQWVGWCSCWFHVKGKLDG